MSDEKRVDEEWKERARREAEEAERIAGEQKRRERAALEASFMTFLSSLAAQALIHLGAIENPVTKKKEPGLEEARYTIDVIGMLDEKTRGNLTPEEDQYMRAVLHDLRMRYVEALGSGSG